MKRCVAVLVWLAAGLAAQPPPGPALVPSDELNKELPKWVRFSGEYRARFEGFTGGGSRRDSEDAYFLNRFRLNLKLQPADWMKFVFQGQDARVFGNDIVGSAPPYQDTMDLRMAYLELGDPEKKPLSVRVGRQELAFGEQRLVGALNWTNASRTFDAVRATFRYKGYRLDAFAASVVNIRDGEFNKRLDGNNLHGLYGGIEKLVPKATLEPYVLWRLARGRDFKTVGLRWVGKLPASFDYGLEMAEQVGTTDARAGHWVLGYTIKGAQYKPRVFAEYNYASPRFDTLYPTGHDKHGLADQASWRNIHHLRPGVEVKPSPKWLLTSSYHSFWLVDPRGGLYTSAANRIANLPAGRHVGQEIDVQAAYTFSRQLQVAGGFAHIFPGAVLTKAYNFPYLMVSSTF
ncbi:MAG: alginate export family protein [Acidobacteria bacterium]|nr:alginate export family protein [Acidobacteriota bacterium]